MSSVFFVNPQDMYCDPPSLGTQILIQNTTVSLSSLVFQLRFQLAPPLVPKAHVFFFFDGSAVFFFQRPRTDPFSFPYHWQGVATPLGLERTVVHLLAGSRSCPITSSPDTGSILLFPCDRSQTKYNFILPAVLPLTKHSRFIFFFFPPNPALRGTLPATRLWRFFRPDPPVPCWGAGSDRFFFVRLTPPVRRHVVFAPPPPGLFSSARVVQGLSHEGVTLLGSFAFSSQAARSVVFPIVRKAPDSTPLQSSPFSPPLYSTDSLSNNKRRFPFLYSPFRGFSLLGTRTRSPLLFFWFPPIALEMRNLPNPFCPDTPDRFFFPFFGRPCFFKGEQQSGFFFPFVRLHSLTDSVSRAPFSFRDGDPPSPLIS